MKIYAFSDEAAASVDGQIAAMKRNGLNGTEIRGVDGQSVASITADKAKEVLRKLTDNGLIVWSVGSPIGKIDIEKDDFGVHMSRFLHTLEIANLLECSRMRMFSFYIPAGEAPEKYRNEIIDRLSRMTEIAKTYNVTLCHENEKGIYGDSAARCADILNAVPGLHCIFDPANFIQCGQDIPEAWALLGKRVDYMHIKDALPDGTVVPAGKGIGCLPRILAEFRQNGGEALTVEPHLQVFDGLAALEKDKKTPVAAYAYPSSDAAFDAACDALKALL
ncbi:MAG: TIM barrel protein [Clostridia bacterium]|nr:TIM barrel protein [Clostridia bacterium]